MLGDRELISNISKMLRFRSATVKSVIVDSNMFYFVRSSH